YKAKQVVFAATPMGSGGATGVNVAAVIEDPSPMKLVYDPKNPLADDKGYVTMPNVNVVEEMVNMISASRSYQTNADMMNTAKTLLLKTLNIGQ
ncbi:MAG: flagellar basal body rod protein FlgC, partial [Thiobacillus sp.]|nr:flagellar basal body rod protein FlgC [Thiobacillus sp.]